MSKLSGMMQWLKEADEDTFNRLVEERKQKQNERVKRHRQKGKGKAVYDKVLEKRKEERYVCECGADVTKHNKRRHELSSKHQEGL